MKEDTTNWKRHDFPNIGDHGAVVLTNVPEGGYYMSFRASIVAIGGDVPEFRTVEDRFTADIHKAEADWRGDVKWDQCANFTKDDTGCMFHVCERADVEALAALILAVYDLGKTEIPKWETYGQP